MTTHGHLDCLFDCGLKFDDLETLYLHIELDHREDNSVSPFAVDGIAVDGITVDGIATSAPVASKHSRYADELAPPLPARPTSSTSQRSNHDSHKQTSTGEQERSLPHGGPYNGNRNTVEPDDEYALCREKDCGELILLTDLNEHLNFHDTQQTMLDEDASSSSLANNGHSSSSTPPRSTTMDHSDASSHDRRQTISHKRKECDTDESPRSHMGRRFISMLKSEPRPRSKQPAGKSYTTNQRLGKKELGPYAFETQMPGWMLKKLRDGPKVSKTRRLARNGGLVTHESVDGQVNGVMPILRQLIDLDSAVYKAYLCHPSVTQIGKRTWESGFCGYHNTQMAISYIQNSKHAAHTLFPSYIPGMLDIQDWIETGWDEGINEHARNEFGGLKGTRKWIGTLEIDTLLQYFGIPHQTHQFHDTLEVNNQYADQNLFDWVEQYFASAAIDDGSKVQCTLKPPIYFQRPGHSLTIVGMERMRNGTRNLLVFDPMYQVSASMLQLIEKSRVRETNGKLLRLYRRSQNRMYNYADFEATTLEGDLPLYPAWDVGR